MKPVLLEDLQYADQDARTVRRLYDDPRYIAATTATNLPITITIPSVEVSGTTRYTPSRAPPVRAPKAPDPRRRAQAKAARKARRKNRR